MNEGNENLNSKWKFDPKTGQPINGTAAGQNSANADSGAGQGSTGGQPSAGLGSTDAQPGAGQSFTGAQPSGNRFPVKIAAIVAAVVIAAVVCVKVLAGGVSAKHGTNITKALTEAVFSFEDSKLGQDMNLKKLRTSKTGSIGLDGSVDESGITADVNGTLSYDFGAKKYSIDGKLSAAGIDTDVQLYADSKNISLYVPVLYDKALAYNYTEKNEDGYLAQALESDSEYGTSVTIDQVNSVISYAINDAYDDVLDLYDELVSDTETNLNGQKWTKAEKETFEINGKEVDCKGFQTEISSDDLSGWMDRYESTIENKLKDTESMSRMAAVFGIDDPEEAVRSAFDEYKEEIGDGDGTFTLSYYVFQNKPAAIILAPSGDESEYYGITEIDFKGGSFLLQNVDVLSGGETVLSTEGETDGEKENWTVTSDGETILSYDYDASSGKLEFTSGDPDGYDSVSANGTLKSNGSGYTFKFDGDDTEGSIDLTLTASTKADITKVSADSVDIGSASESELNEIVTDIYSKFYDLGLYY